MEIAYNPFFDSEAGNIYMNFEVAGLEVAVAFLVPTFPRKKHQKEYRQFLAEIGPEAFKRPLLTHRNAITTGLKRVVSVSRDNTKARESILEEDLAKNVSLNLHKSFCLNRESKLEALPNQVKRLQEEGMGAILRTIKSLRRDRDQFRR